MHYRHYKHPTKTLGKTHGLPGKRDQNNDVPTCCVFTIAGHRPSVKQGVWVTQPFNRQIIQSDFPLEVVSR